MTSIFTMNSHTAVLPPIAVHSEYNLHPTGSESYNSLLSSGHQASFGNRRSSSLQTTISPLAPQSNGTGGRMSTRPHDHSFYPPTTQHSDSAAPTIATNPASHHNPLGISNYPSPHYSTTSTLAGHHNTYPSATQTYENSVFGYNTITSGPVHGLSNARPRLALQPSASLVASERLQAMDSTPPSPSSGSGIRETYATSIPDVNRHLHARNAMDTSRPSYSSKVSDSPRQILSPQDDLASDFDHPPSMSASHRKFTPAQLQLDPAFPPFDDERTFFTIQDSHGNVVTPTVVATSIKGFQELASFLTYRRNYLTIETSYNLKPWPAGDGCLFVRQGGKPDQAPLQIQAFALCLRATADSSSGKLVDLVHYTPKRDKGPQMNPPMVKVRPVAPPAQSQRVSDHQSYQMGYPLSNHQSQPHQSQPHLPLQGSNTHDGCADVASGDAACTNTFSHTFERIQFKCATANNGKRRAQQQYFHLVAELHADVRKDASCPPKWLKVAQVASQPIVVRGRSPSHYTAEDYEWCAKHRPDKLPAGHPARIAWEQGWSQGNPTTGHDGQTDYTQSRYSGHGEHTTHYNQVNSLPPYVPLQGDLAGSMRQSYALNGSDSSSHLMTSQAEDHKPIGYTYHPQALPYNMSTTRVEGPANPAHAVAMASGRTSNDVAVDTSRGLYHYSNADQMRNIMNTH